MKKEIYIYIYRTCLKSSYRLEKVHVCKMHLAAIVYCMWKFQQMKITLLNASSRTAHNNYKVWYWVFHLWVIQEGFIRMVWGGVEKVTIGWGSLIKIHTLNVSSCLEVESNIPSIRILLPSIKYKLLIGKYFLPFPLMYST